MIQKKTFEKAVINGYYSEIRAIINDLETGAEIQINPPGRDNYTPSEEVWLLILQLLSDFMKQEGEK